MRWCPLQDPEQRPLITEVKDALLAYARLHFKSQSPEEAMVLKHMKERALLNQILPPKVTPSHFICLPPTKHNKVRYLFTIPVCNTCNSDCDINIYIVVLM